MTPRDARKAAENWALSMARAYRAGDGETAEVYWQRMLGERACLLPDLVPAFDTGFDAAFRAERARLEGETGP